MAIWLVVLAAAMPRAYGTGVALAAQAEKTTASDDEFEKARQLLQRHEYFEALKGCQKTWGAFTAKNAMVWPQYWDEDRTMQRTFDVRVFPTYVLLDGDGIERLRVSGTGYHEAKVLADRVEEQVTAARKQNYIKNLDYEFGIRARWWWNLDGGGIRARIPNSKFQIPNS